MKNIKKVIVTGGYGFIGSNLVKYLLKKNYFVINIDKLAYSANLYNLKDLKKNKYVVAGSCRSPTPSTSPSSSSPASPSTSSKSKRKQMLKEKIKKELRDARRKKGQSSS